MIKIQAPRFKLVPTSATYSLETNVSRVDIDRRQIGQQFHKFLLIIQQNHVGGHTITGWPSGVQFIGTSDPNPVPGSQTVYQWFTNDGGASWAVEVNRIGTASDDSGLPAGTADDQVLVYNQTGGTPGWQPTLLQPKSLDTASILHTNTGKLFGYNDTKFFDLGYNVTVQSSGQVEISNPLDSPRYFYWGSTGTVLYGVNDGSLTGSNVEDSSVSIYMQGISSGTLPRLTMSIGSYGLYSAEIGLQADISSCFAFVHGPLRLRSSGGSEGAVLSRDQNNSLALVNGVNSQMFSVYNTSSSSNANYRRFRTYWSSSTVIMAAESAGSLASNQLNVVVNPKNSGFFSLSLPDNAVAGGNTRGQRSVDLQTIRQASTQVASGTDCLLGPGSGNTAGGTRTAVLASSSAHITSGTNIFVAGASDSTAVGGVRSVVMGSDLCTLNGTNNVILSSSNTVVSTSTAVNNTAISSLNVTFAGNCSSSVAIASQELQLEGNSNIILGSMRNNLNVHPAHEYNRVIMLGDSWFKFPVGFIHEEDITFARQPLYYLNDVPARVVTAVANNDSNRRAGITLIGKAMLITFRGLMTFTDYANPVNTYTCVITKSWKIIVNPLQIIDLSTEIDTVAAPTELSLEPITVVGRQRLYLKSTPPIDAELLSQLSVTGFIEILFDSPAEIYL